MICSNNIARKTSLYAGFSNRLTNTQKKDIINVDKEIMADLLEMKPKKFLKKKSEALRGFSYVLFVFPKKLLKTALNAEERRKL